MFSFQFILGRKEDGIIFYVRNISHKVWQLRTVSLIFFSFSAREIIGGENEHIAFLWSHALELQGQVLKAFVNSVIYKFLDPEVFLSSFLDSKHLNTSLSQ